MHLYSLYTIFVYQFLSMFFVAVFLCLPIFHFYVFYFCQFFIFMHFYTFYIIIFPICVVIHKKLAKYAAYTKEYSCIKSYITIHNMPRIHCVKANFIYQFLTYFCYKNRTFLPIFHFTAFYTCQFSLFLRFYKIILAFYVSVCYNSLAR